MNTADLVEPRSPAYAVRALGRALSGTLRGAPVRVLAPEDFVLFKALSTRERDVEDAAAVVRMLGDRLDRSLVEAEAARLAPDVPEHDLRSRLPARAGGLMRLVLSLALLLLAAACPRSPPPIDRATAIVRAFARESGLPAPVGLEGFRLEVFPDQASMWAAYQRSIGGDPDAPLPRPTTVAVPGRGVIFVVDRAAFARAAPAVAALRPDAWIRVIAHELAHVWHEQVSGGRIGPRWFAEGLAVLAAGQGIGEQLQPGSTAAALEPIDWQDPHAYERAAAAVRHLAMRVPVRELVARAGEPDFAAWVLRAAP